MQDYFKQFSKYKKIIDQPQFDGYHKHPVDVHSINALKIFRRIKKDEIKTIYEELTNEQKLTTVRLVSFFHDIGKGRTEDHHIVGEKLFKKYA